MLKQNLKKEANEMSDFGVPPKRHCSRHDDTDEEEDTNDSLNSVDDNEELEVEISTESPTIAMEYDVKIDKYDIETGDILQEILKIVQATNENVKKLQNANLELMYQVQSLRKENIKLCNQFTSKFESASEVYTNLMPKTPFTSIPELKSYEQKLKDSTELCKSLENELCKIMIDDPGKFIRSSWKKFFTDELANQFSWRGSHDKQTVRYLRLTSIIRGAFNRKFNSTEKRFDFCTVRWFQTANDRLKYKNKQEKFNKDPLASSFK